MDDASFLLIQKFVDGELTGGEPRAFLRLLDEHPETCRLLLASEAMLEAAAALPAPAIPADFVSRTTAHLPPLSRTARLSPPRWMPAVAAACLLLALGFWAGRVQAPRAPIAARTASLPPSKQVLVRLVLLQPMARSVTVVGDFNGWDPRRTPLERREGGVFHVTLPLDPGRYHYMYVVDGRNWVADPFAAETSLDGFGAQNSVIDVGI